MRYLRLIPMVLFLLFAVLAGSAVLYGRTLAAPPAGNFQSVGLDTCDNKLCLFHVTPGITSYDEAKNVLASYITRDESNHFHGQIGALQLRVETDETGTQTRVVDVQSPRSSPDALSLRFSQFIQQYGTPCYVSTVMAGEDSLVMVYPSFRVVVLASENHISLNSAIGGITLVNDSDACSGVNGAIPWRGFASLQSYQGNGWTSYYPSYSSSGSYGGYGNNGNGPNYSNPINPRNYGSYPNNRNLGQGNP
jgi:hypothetical protein